jgi:hypothetical protein
MLNIDNNSYEDWQDYFRKTFKKSGLYEWKEIGTKGIVYEEEYIPINPQDKTRIKISYFGPESLCSLDIRNPSTPGYNKLMENEYFYKYDFTPGESYGGPGLEFIQINLDAIHKQISNGLWGKEIKYFRNGKHVKSDVYLFPDQPDFAWKQYFDGSSIWARLSRRIFKIKKYDALDKEEISLNKIFGGLKNVT